MCFIPMEVEIAGVYVPPILPVGILGVLAMLLTIHLLRRKRLLSRFFVLPEVVMLALTAIYMCILGHFVIPL